MNKRMIILIVITSMIFLVGIIIWIYFRNIRISSPIAEIRSEGRIIATLPLDTPDDMLISTESGYNRIIVSDGAVAVTEADCPDNVCVKTGAISDGGVPIICLPHRLEIRIISDPDALDGQLK